jgi:hypothetical protein
LVGEKLAGKGIEDKEEAFGFAAEDLKMSVDDAGRAGADARDVAGALSSDGQLRALAAKMLNDQLGPAVGEVFGIGGDDLKDLLVEVRLQLRRQGLSLLLLVEDFAIFQGIQGGLVDAITLIPTQDLDLCPMRVVMAVNTGYFINEMPNSLKSRVYKVFDLDDPDPQVSFSPVAVAARYMNAIRVGSQRLEETHTNNVDTPNACEQCPVNQACHAAFGSADGYGLFPFNKNALTKTVKSKTVDDRLSVRDFLTRVLRPVMFKEHDAIDQGNFPNPEFDSSFRSGAVDTLASVEDEVRLNTPGDSDLSKRRVVLVRYWGPEGTEPRNLQPTIHAAFDIPMLKGLPGEDEATEPRPPLPSPFPDPAPRKPDRPDTKQKAPLPALVRAIDDWRAANVMLQGSRNELRNQIHAAVTARLSLDDGLGGSSMWTNTGKHWDVTFEAQTSIAFGDQQMTGAIITIDKDDDEDVRALRALAWVNATEDWGKVENGAELQRVVEEKVSAWASTVSEALFSNRDNRDDVELAVAANTLLTMSKALGVSDAFKDEALSRTRALFAHAPLNPEAPRPKLRQWQKRISEDSQRLSREQLQGRVLRLASFTQGAGSPLALDLPRLTKALRGKESGRDLPLGTGLLEETAKTVKARHQALPEVKEEASFMVPDLSDLGGDLPEVIKQLENLVNERANAGQLPSAINRAALTAAGKLIKLGDKNRVEGVRAKLESWDTLSLDEQVRLLTDDWDEAAARVRQWLDLATRAVEALEAKLGGGANSASQVEYDQARSALVSTLKDVAALLDPTPNSMETP